MDYLSDYWLWHSAYEIPRNYALWSGITLISSLVHKKALYFQGNLQITAELYTALVGQSGNSKSVTALLAKMMFEKVSDFRLLPSSGSPEMIVKMLNEDETCRPFINPYGEKTIIRPFIGFINEFENFLGRSPEAMIKFLTDIHGQPSYRNAFLNRGEEFVINPVIVILACFTPNWFIHNMKGTTLTGGIIRRFVLVHEGFSEDAHSVITFTPEQEEAQVRILQRLKDVKELRGVYKWGDGFKSYDAWYRDNFDRRRKEKNEVLSSYLRSKTDFIIKLMMLLDIVSDKPMFVLTEYNFESAKALLDSIEPNMERLFIGGSRNETIAGQQKVLDIVSTSTVDGFTGWIPQKELVKVVEGDFKNPNEILMTLMHLQKTERIHIGKYPVKNKAGIPIDREMVLSWELWEKFKQARERLEQEKKKGLK